jgi:hypothetical protein
MNAAEQEQPAKALRAWHHGAIFLLASAVIVSRRPEAVFHAQFWAEDGAVWYADAYNSGWSAALFRAFFGYLEIFPRLGASLALLVPFSFAPLVLNLMAICMQALPTNLLLSSRSSVWGSIRYRVLMGAMYLSLPNCWEIDATITNSQWLLALIAVLLVVSTRPRSAAGRLLDLCAFSLCGLSGPFCIFLFPIALFLAWKHRDRWRWIEVGVLAACCSVQLWNLLNGGLSSRPHLSLGAGPVMLARLLAGQVYLGTLLGSTAQPPHLGLGWLIALIGIAAGGTALVIACFLQSPLPMRLFLLFSAMLLAASLIAPALGTLTGVTAWQGMIIGAGARYWFFPTLAFAWTILWCFHGRSRVLKSASAFLLCIMCFGVALRWRHTAFRDMHFADYARKFDDAPAGTAVVIPENPEGWSLRLVKRPHN